MQIFTNPPTNDEKLSTVCAVRIAVGVRAVRIGLIGRSLVLRLVLAVGVAVIVFILFLQDIHPLLINIMASFSPLYTIGIKNIWS